MYYHSFHGESYVKWTETNSEVRAPDLKFISREKYTREIKYVVFEKTSLEAGVHEYPFSYRLPNDKMPSSFEGKRGCSRYWLYLKISRPLPWRDVVSDRCITFTDDVDINLQYYAKPLTRKKSTRLSKMLGLGDAGVVTLTAKINRTGYCAGEAVPVTVDAVNSSSKDLGKLKVSLVQEVVYKANGEQKVENTVIYTKTGSDPIKQGQTRSWKDELIHIDAVPPSTRMRASYCLLVSYYIKVYVDISFLSGGDLVLWLPITIGTYHQGYKKTAPATAATHNIPVIDLSNTLTHTRCNRGWERFSLSTDNAIPEYVCYTPMCVYVPNYVYKPKTAVISPLKQVAAKKSAAVQVKTAPASRPKTVTSSSSAVSGTKAVATTVPATTSPARAQSAASGAVGTASVTTAAQASTNTTGVRPSAATRSMVSKPSATQASNSLTSVQGSGSPSNTVATGTTGRLEPSAPPLFSDENEANKMTAISLPSYEELFGQGEAEGKIEEEDTSTGKVFLLIRFKSAKREEFINTMKNYSTGLQKFHGYLSALQHKVSTVSIGKWEKASLMAIFTFESDDMAQNWLKSTPQVCMEDWLGGCDILIMESLEPFQQDHQILSISNTVVKVDETNEDFIRYKYILNEFLKPARIRLGGVCVAKSKTTKCLRGHWDMKLEDGVTILSWPTLAIMRQYRTTVDPDIYQESVALRGKAYDVVLSVAIQLGPLPNLTKGED